MRALGLGESGAVRAGIVHYNTEAEVDRLLEALSRLLIIGGTRFLGPRGDRDRARARPRRDDVHARPDEPGPLSRRRDALRRPRRRTSTRCAAATGTPSIDTCGYYPRVVEQSVSLLRDAVPFYVFVSSVSAYGDLVEPPTEDSPIAELPPDVTESLEFYGAAEGGVRARRRSARTAMRRRSSGRG